MRLLIFLIVLTFNPQVHSAISFKMTKERGATSFLAIGNPSAIRIDGKGEGPEGSFTSLEKGEALLLDGQIKVSLKSYDTGIGLRDRHMKDKYLEVGKFEDAILTMNGIAVPKAALAKESETKLPFTGTLELHGMKKNISGDFMVKLDTGGLKVNAAFKIKLSDYGINIPSFAGITVADQVEVNAMSNVERIQ